MSCLCPIDFESKLPFKFLVDGDDEVCKEIALGDDSYIPIKKGIEDEYNMVDSSYNSIVRKRFGQYYEWKVFNKNNKVLHTSLDSVYIDNYSLKECISLLSDKEIKQVKTNNQLKEKTKLTISYRTKSNSNNANQYKTEIINELQKLYNFDIIKESEESLLNKIIITDSLKFNQKSSYNNDYVKKSFNSKYIDIKNGKVHDLIASFNKMYRDSFFYSTIDSKRRLSIKIEKMPMNELIILLEKDYGLSIVKSKGNNSIYKIIFN